MLAYTTYHIPESKNHQTGLYGKWLWMVIPDSNSEQDQELLRKIATALQADPEGDVYLISQSLKEPLSLSALGKSMPKLIISFGSSPEQLGIWIDLMKPGIRVLEHFTFILTLSPEALSGNALAKKELWGFMQSYLEAHAL